LPFTVPRLPFLIIFVVALDFFDNIAALGEIYAKENRKCDSYRTGSRFGNGWRR
jgi:hypothetical protein